MPQFSIRAEKLSKLYRIGLKEQMHETFGGAAIDFLRAPMKNFRQLRGLTDISAQDSGAEDVIWALHDVSFEVREGEVLGIIGANGAGKSTLLKVLSGITEPTSGRALVRGRVACLLEVGTGFHPDLTGRENAYLNGTILGMTKVEVDRKFDEIVAFSGVEKFIDTPVKRYSSGMRVRLAFAVAAHLEPEILFIDEVLAVGDLAFQRKCLGRMSHVAKEGRTVLFVSHNLASIASLCERGVLLDQGRIVYEGAIDETLAAYDRLVDGKANAELSSLNSSDAIVCQVPVVLSGADRLLPETPLTFEWVTEVRSSHWEVTLQLILRNAAGSYLSLPKLSSQANPELVKPGAYRVRVRMPRLWLAPGSYYARAKAIAEGPGGSHRYFSETVNFHVLLDKEVDEGGAPHLLQPPCEWSVHPVSANASSPESIP